ncbi:MAG: oligosaccharide flippase family protein [Proteobacteria bacterium]|nr:oligosaccharide flippase family protein [Pseudomonadota bacterium]
MDRQGDRPALSFFSNVVQLISGSVVAQGLTVLTLPILSRLFEPQAIGLSSLFLSITSFIGVLACLRYELAIMLPESNEDAANLFGGCLVVTTGVTVITACLIPFISEGLLNRLNAIELMPYLYLIPVAIMVNGFYLALNYWNSRTKHFGRLSIARVTASVVHNTVRLGSGLLGYVNSGVLIISQIIGQFVTTSVLGGQIFRDHNALFKKSIRVKPMMAGLKRHWKFPLISSWSVAFNTLSLQLPSWLLAFYFSPAIVGYFALCRMVLGMPMNLIGMSVSQVFFQRISEAAAGSEDLGQVVSGVFRRLVSLGLFPFLLLTLIGDDAFVFVFGGKWADAGFFAQILSLAIFFQFISSPLIVMFTVLEKQGTHLLLDMFLLISRFAALVTGGLKGNATLALVLYACCGILYYLIFQIWLSKTLNTSFSILLKPLAKFGGYSIPSLALPVILKWQFQLSPLWVFLAGCLCAVPYYLFVLKEDESLQKPVLAIFHKTGLDKLHIFG